MTEQTCVKVFTARKACPPADDMYACLATIATGDGDFDICGRRPVIVITTETVHDGDNRKHTTRHGACAGHIAKRYRSMFNLYALGVS